MSREEHEATIAVLPASGPPGDLSRSTALVIDGHPASRTALAAMLKDLGVGSVVRTPRVDEARSLIEAQHFHIVISEYHFENQPMTGQDLLDDLRLAHLLRLSTVVIMISSEAAYANVACAAEAALDAYLIKPHTGEALRGRVLQALERKAALSAIFERVDAGDFAAAAALCQRRCDERGPNWLNAARVGAELWLRLGDAQAAQRLFGLILSTQALPWARLGYARSAQQSGAVQQAQRTLQSLLQDQPGYVDAYDVMSRVLLDQGDPAQALRALRQACALTPGNVTRQLKLGTVAFFHGDRREAVEALKRASALGLNSRVFDLQALVLLGLLHFDRGDGRGLAHALRCLVAARKQQPGVRARRFEHLLSTLKLLHERRIADAVRATREAMRELQDPDFPFEAACHLLCLLGGVLRREVRLEEARECIGALADRHAVSRASCELLCRAVQDLPEYMALVRRHYQRICDCAEEAVSHTVGGAPREAVRLLLARFEATRNAKLLDLALHTLERHHARIDAADELLARAQALKAGDPVVAPPPAVAGYVESALDLAA